MTFEKIIMCILSNTFFSVLGSLDWGRHERILLIWFRKSLCIESSNGSGRLPDKDNSTYKNKVVMSTCITCKTVVFSMLSKRQLFVHVI